MYGNLSSWSELALAFLLSGQKSQPLPRKCWTCRKVLKSSLIFARAYTKDPTKNSQRVGVCRKNRSHRGTGANSRRTIYLPSIAIRNKPGDGLLNARQAVNTHFLQQGPSHYGSEMPIAAFSSRDASQYSYFSATLKSCCISSGVGGAGGLFGSNGRASSRKKL